MNTLITILDGITETSMPFNEFVLYRANHFKDENQILIICGPKKELPKVTVPENLEIVYAGRNLFRIRKTILSQIKGCNDRHDFYAIHLHQNKSSVLSQIAMIGTGFSRKTVFTIHSTFTGYKLHNKIQSYISGLFAHNVTCVSKASYAAYPSSLKRIKGSRVLPLQNGVDIERVDSLLTNEKVENDKLTFVYVARMIPLKNHNFLLDVIKETNNKAHFLFIGAEDENIMKRIKEEHLGDKITCTGLIPRNDVFRKLEQSDVYISSSTLEGLPISVLEGMYAGLPAILSDIVQHREVGENSALIKLLPFDKAEWVEAINRMCQIEKEEIQRLGYFSRKYVRDNFSLEKMHNQYTQIYETLRNR